MNDTCLPRKRVDLEKVEAAALAPYAARAAEARREHREPEHDLRTAFARDRDRIIHCAAFRRLEAKTQVFPSRKTDHQRTRLTHTFEVAQIARSLARALGLNVDLAEAIALAHDLGHPPFGHTGERALAELMAACGGFEHNRHSLRVVEVLEHPYPDFRGLNLTYEVREGLARHGTDYDAPPPDPRFAHPQPSLEARVVDLADPIAYNSHDLDDAMAAGLIDETMLDGVHLWRRLHTETRRRFPDAHAIAQRQRTVKALIDWSVHDVLKESAARIQKANPRGLDDVRNAPHRLADFSPAGKAAIEQLQSFMLQRVYRHPLMLERDEKVREQIGRLFEAFVRRPELMPNRWSARIADQGPHRVACDYIAGMTDRYAESQLSVIGPTAEGSSFLPAPDGNRGFQPPKAVPFIHPR